MMARTGQRGREHREELIVLLSNGPQKLGGRAWFRATWRTVVEFIEDDLPDRAASLTYYAMLSIFPGLLVLLAVVSLVGGPTGRNVLNGMRSLAIGPTADVLNESINSLQQDQRAAGIFAVVAFLIAFWSATGYVGAFRRAVNAIYDVPEGRPLWKTVPVQLFVTLITGIFLALSALTVFLSGRLAGSVGHGIGLQPDTVRIYEIIKWPALVVVFALVIALLYWVAPNARHGFRWITPGTVLATFVWMVVSAGFAFYVANFDSYNRTYGTLGGVVVFLVWMWLTNVAVLLGAEFDAELARARAIAAGLPPHAEPYLPMREVPDQEPAVPIADQ
jgi:membrane protein